MPSNSIVCGIKQYIIQYASVKRLTNVHEKHQNEPNFRYCTIAVLQNRLFAAKHAICAILLKERQLQYLNCAVVARDHFQRYKLSAVMRITHRHCGVVNISAKWNNFKFLPALHVCRTSRAEVPRVFLSLQLYK